MTNSDMSLFISESNIPMRAIFPLNESIEMLFKLILFQGVLNPSPDFLS
jgi:hypothetical protein